MGIAERFPRFVGRVGKQFCRFPMLSTNRHCVPCMFDSLRVQSPLSNLMEVKD